MKVLVLDNYDSFTYNLVQYLGELGADVETVRNDRASTEELLARGYDRCVVSPGPCTPNEAGISLEVVRRFPEAGVPTLGVCLGHQSLAQAFGGEVKLHDPIHGKATTIEHDGRTIFSGLREELDGRALSLAGRWGRAARLPRGDGARRRRADGAAPPRAAGRGRAVPPGVGSHRTGPRAARELPRAARDAEPRPHVRDRPARLAPGPAARAGRRGARRDHARRRLGDPDRRLPDRAAHEGGDGGRARGPRAHDARAGRARAERPRGPARHRGHRRRAQHVQRLDHGRPDRRRRGLRGRQARQPLGDEPLRLGGRARGARRAHRPRPRPGRRVHRGVRLRLHVRPRPPPGDALRRSRSATSSRCARSSTCSGR